MRELRHDVRLRVSRRLAARDRRLAVRGWRWYEAGFSEPRLFCLRRARADYHQLVLHTLLLLAYLIAMPLIVAAAAYGFMWGVLCLVRFIPVIGRKHRHSDWDRLNK